MEQGVIDDVNGVKVFFDVLLLVEVFFLNMLIVEVFIFIFVFEIEEIIINKFD